MEATEILWKCYIPTATGICVINSLAIFNIVYIYMLFFFYNSRFSEGVFELGTSFLEQRCDYQLGFASTILHCVLIDSAELNDLKEFMSYFLLNFI